MMIMKIIMLSLCLSLSPALKAESEYVTSIQHVFKKMIAVKNAKTQAIRSTKGMPEVPRSAAINQAVHQYKDQMEPLMAEEASIRDRFYGRVSLAEEAFVNAEKEKLWKFLYEDPAMEEAANEINMTAFSK